MVCGCLDNSKFLQDIQQGLTPNPDIVCNEKIKFGVLQKHILSRMGASLMATGHYARVNRQDNGMAILILIIILVIILIVSFR